MKRLLLLISFSLLVAASTQGGIVLSDTFAYPDGGIITNSGGVWVPNTGTANSMLVSNQQLIASTSRTEDMAAALSGAPYNTNGSVPALYASFTLKCTGRPSLGGAYFAHFTGPNQFGPLTGHRARVWASITNVATVGVADDDKFMLTIVNTSGGSAGNTQWPAQLATNVTYTVVIKYEIATLNSTLWIDPTSESDPSVVANDFPVDLFDTANGLVNVANFGFRQATGEGTLWIDNLKVGTQFGDVAGTNTSPLISGIANQSVPASTVVGPLPFAVQDGETVASSLIISNSTSNPALIPSANILVGGSGTNRTLTITPTAGQQGSALITLYVSDGQNVSSTSFTVKVGAPSMSPLANQVSPINVPTAAIPLVVYDPEGNALTLSSNISNPTLISSVAISGSGSNYNIVVTPAASQVGFSTISIIASDSFNSVTQSFVVTFYPLMPLIYSDDFSYPDGSLYGNGTWSLTSGTALETQVENGEVILSRFNSEDLNSGAGFGGGAPFAPSSGVVLFSGFTLRARELPSSTGNYFAHFKDNTTAGFRARIFASSSGATPGYFRIGLANNSGSVSAQVTRDLATNTTYLVVTRYNTATGEGVIWVNPKSGSETGVPATDNPSTMTVHQYALRQDTGMGVLRLDNLKIGTAVSDVVAIPALNQTLTNAVLNSELVLSWGTPLFALQSADSINGPWLTIHGATSPYTNAPTASQKYFRLSY